jgi:DNA-binding NarL/FixJ family response regulator
MTTTPIEHEGLGASLAARRTPAGVMLIDDFAILRDGLRALLSAERDFEVIAEAAGVEEGVVLAKQLQPHAVIIGISLPEGGAMEAIGTLRRECPGTGIVVLTVHNTEECWLAAMRAGAHGFVPKDATFDVLLAALRSTVGGQERNATSLQPAGLRGARAVRQNASPVGNLTFRERQVLVGVAQGYTSKEIAVSLGRSVKTVSKHRANMMRKLSLHDASSVTRFAIATGLLTL